MVDDLYIKAIESKEYPNDDIYPFNIPVIKNFKSINFNKPVTFIIGENGSGKSTLIEAIAISLGFNPEGGGKNLNFSTNSNHSDLYKYIKIIKGPIRWRDGYFLRSESFYNVASKIEELGVLNYYGGNLHNMSHGESFINLVKHRFVGNGIYILDEPESALSPQRQLSLLILIKELVNLNSQFIIATHSPILLGYPDSDIFQIEDGKLEKVKYEDTEIYILTKKYLDDPKSFLNELFKN